MLLGNFRSYLLPPPELPLPPPEFLGVEFSVWFSRGEEILGW